MLNQPELFPSVNQIPPTGLTTQKEQAVDLLEGLRRKEEGGIVPINSRWKLGIDGRRIWVVVERKPFGRLIIQEEGRAYLGEISQRRFLELHIRLPKENNREELK